MIQKWIGEMSEKTGRSLQQWIDLIKKKGPKTPNACRDWLKEEHRLANNLAGWLSQKVLGSSLNLAEETPEAYLRAAPQYVDRMYSGAKAAMRPVHDMLIQLARTLGDEVRICPCATIVPLYRRHVFAQIKPATAKRIDLGLALEEEPFTSRLLDTGGLERKDRITHRVAIFQASDIDLQVKRWLKQAYERDGGRG